MRKFVNKSEKKYSKSYQVLTSRKKNEVIHLKYPFVVFDDSNTQTFTQTGWKNHLDEFPKDARRVNEGVEATLTPVTTEDGTKVYEFTRYYPSLEGVEGNLAIGTLCGYMLQERNMKDEQKVSGAIKIGGKDIDAVIENLQALVFPDGKDEAVESVEVKWLADPFVVSFTNRDGSKTFKQNVSALSITAVEKKSEA